MLRRQREIRAQVQKLIDGGLFAFALWLAHWWRSESGIAVFGGTPEIDAFGEYLWLWLLIIPITPLVLEVQGFYSRPFLFSRRVMVWQLFKATILMTTIIISVTFLFKEQPSRLVIIASGPVAFLLVLIKEELLRQWLGSKLGLSQVLKRVILLGAPEDTLRVKAELGQRKHPEFEVVAQLNLNEASVDDLVQLIHDHSANGVILSAKHSYFGQVEKAIQACELEGVETWLLADFFNTHLSKTSIDDFYGRPMLVFRTTREDTWQAVAKQVVDVLGATALLLLSLPFTLFAAIAIKLSSPGPIFFVQKRSGLNGQPFYMLKFRTMVTNAEQRKHELASMNEMGGPVFKITNDPRITPIGKWLRKYSIDELPQLVNVLRGEMSLVGPRPLPVDETMKFDDFAHRRRLSVRPGLTCLWQISGRNEVKDFKDWVRLDLEYIDNWSLWLDLKILLRTVPVVILGTGAK